MGLKDWWRAFAINTATTIIIGILSGTLPPMAVLWAYGFGFITATHPIPGWAILGALVGAGLLVFSIGLNAAQWLRDRRRRRRTLTIVAEGYPNALNWSMGEKTAPVKAPVMMPCGDFHITNVTSSNMTIPRTVLVARYRLWGVIPWRRRVDGAFPSNVIQGRHLLRERLIWMVEPPFLNKGQTMRARVGLVDNLGQVNWGEWYDWSYLG